MSAAEVAARPITRELAAFASALRYEDLPPASVEMAKRLLLEFG